MHFKEKKNVSLSYSISSMPQLKTEQRGESYGNIYIDEQFTYAQIDLPAL